MKKLILLSTVLLLTATTYAQTEVVECSAENVYKTSVCKDNTPPPYRFQIKMHDGTVIKSHEITASDDATARLVIYSVKNEKLIPHEIFISFANIKSVKAL